MISKMESNDRKFGLLYRESTTPVISLCTASSCIFFDTCNKEAGARLRFGTLGRSFEYEARNIFSSVNRIATKLSL